MLQVVSSLRRSLLIIAVLVVGGLAGYLYLTAKCRASTPPRRGAIESCCGSGPDRVVGWYWTGSSCSPDTACQCDARPAHPSWRTFEACVEAHEGCETDEATGAKSTCGLP